MKKPNTPKRTVAASIALPLALVRGGDGETDDAGEAEKRRRARAGFSGACVQEVK